MFLFYYFNLTIFKIVSGYTIVSLCQDTQLCLGLVSVCSNIFHFFHCLKFFLLLFIFHHRNFPDAFHRKLHPGTQ